MRIGHIGTKMIICMVLMLFSATSAYSATGQIPQDRTIVSIRTYVNYAVLEISPSFSNALCPGPDGARFIIIDWATNSEAKGLLNAALGAFFLGKKIGAGIQNICHPFSSGTPTIYRIDIR